MSARTFRSYAAARSALVEMLGEAALTHDVGAIAGEMITYDYETRTDEEGKHLTTIEKFTIPEQLPDRFWDIVARH